MASFSKKIGYVITDAPKSMSSQKASDPSSRMRIVRGHKDTPGQDGVRLLITGVRSEYIGCRGTDRTDFYRTHLTVARANDVLPKDSLRFLSARPELDHELSFVHADYYGGKPHTENSELDVLFKYCIGPSGEDVTVYDLISGKVDSVAFNAPLYRKADMVQSKSGLRRTFGISELDTEGEDLATDWDVLLQKDGQGGYFGISKPVQPPNLALHRERTAQAGSMVRDYLQKMEIERGNAMLAEDASFVGTMDGPEV